MSGGVSAGVKLNPCPFCGSAAEFFGYQGATKAKCSNEDCEAETGPWFADIDCNSFGAAAKKWNTRATPTPPIEGRDADVEREAHFLLDRLVDHEVRMTSEQDAREWYGHVTPSMARLRAALQALGERP